eukprot:1119156-Pelagomonas_calceolata.AAC.2
MHMCVWACLPDVQAQDALVAHAPACFSVPIPALHLAVLHIPTPLGLRPTLAVTVAPAGSCRNS